MTDNVINAGNVNWQFNPNTLQPLFDFLSPDRSDVGLRYCPRRWALGWSQRWWCFWHCHSRDVPDSGMTLSLLGGALVGIGALRRKFSC